MNAALDLDAALDRVGGDRELLAEIAQVFLADYPNQLAALEDGMSRQDAGVVEKSAHTIKGSVATFGAADAVASALAIERAGRAKDLHDVPQLYEGLLSQLMSLDAELRALSA